MGLISEGMKKGSKALTDGAEGVYKSTFGSRARAAYSGLSDGAKKAVKIGGAGAAGIAAGAVGRKLQGEEEDDSITGHLKKVLKKLGMES
ncbi:MAG TPA: hypothetical protein DD732_02930 [Rhizobiales bacterium]|jgi:hypothetical protein|nr:hypothetical protein [Hyphomicrobiales bacterium]